MKRILLALDHKENSHSLQFCLGQEHEVIVANGPQVWPSDFDLAIIDRLVLDRHAAQIQARRQSGQPAFLPFLLVTSRSELQDIQQHLGPTVDDLILSPIEQIEVQSRIRNLLRARQLSLEILHSASGQKRGQEDLQLSEKQYRLLFEQGQAGVYCSTVGGQILVCNPAFAHILGYEAPEEIVHCAALDLYFEAADRESFLTRLETQGAVTNLESCLRRRDGQPVWVLESANLIRDATGRPEKIQGMLIDIGERKAAEEAIRQRTAQLEALRQLDLELTATLDLDDLLRSIVSYAIRLVDASSGGIYLYQPEQDVLVRKVSVGNRPLPLGTIRRRGEGLSGKVWESGQPQCVDDYRRWDEHATTPWEPQIAATMAAPVRWSDEFLGVLTASARPATRSPFSQADLELLSSFANQAAIAVHNAQLFDAERTARNRAEKLQAATQALSTTLDLQRVFELILSELRHVVPYDSASVQQIQGSRMEIIGGHGFPNLDELLGETFDLTAEDNPNRVVVHTRAPLILDDAPVRYEAFCREPHAQAGIRAWLGVPMIFGERLIGLIALDKKEPGFYTEEHARQAMAFAAQAAIAVENARLFEAERVARAQAETHVADLVARERYLAVLNDITQATLQMPDLTSTLQVLADRLGELIGADGCYITLWDEETHRPLPAAAYGPFRHTYRGFQPRSDEVTATESVLRVGRPLVVEDVFDTPYLSPHIAASFPTRSMLALPLVAGDRKVGAALVSFEKNHHFTPDEIVLCEKITGQITLVLTKALWYEETQQRLKELTLLFETSTALSTTLDVNTALHTIAQRLTAFLDIAGCAILACEQDQDALVLLLDYSSDPDWSEPQPAGTLYPLDRYPATRQVLTDYQPLAVQVSDPDADPAEVAWMIKEKVVSLLMVPLVTGDRAIGLLELMETDHERAFRPTEIRLCQMLANQAAGALDMRRLYDEARRRNRELALLNRVIAASATGQEIEEILKAVCLELALAFNVPQATAALLDADRTELTVVAEYRAEGQRSAAGQTIPLSGSPFFQHLLRQRAPLVIDDVRTDPRLVIAHGLDYWRDVASSLIVPLIVEDELVGGLAIDGVKPHVFTESEVALARRVAEQVSGALARARLAKSQQRLSTAVEQAAEIVIISATHGIVIYTNPAFEQVTGYSRAETVGRHPKFLIGDERNVRAYRKMQQTLPVGGIWQGQINIQKKDGTFCIVDATISPVRNLAGEVVNYIATMRDVTREKELDEQFRQAQKIEAIGRLAGGVAHDFNNLLTVIHLSTRIMEHKLRPEDPLWEHVQRVQDAGRRAANLTQQLLAFGRREIVQPLVLDINGVVGDLGKMLRRLIREDIELTTHLAGDLWLVKIDPTQVEQVVVNLAVNARDAMPTGGQLTIETANVVLDAAYAARHLDVEPGEYVLLAVSDTGTGMSDEVMAHLFEPFFTTKDRGMGTGLGLSTVFGIVKQNGGHIGVYSEMGQGTTFKIYVPRGIDSAQAAPLPDSAVTHSLRGTETILLVEDEGEVQQLAADILRAHGYRVLAARNGTEALQIAASHQEVIHLLLTDVVMPGMSGKQLADQLQAERPTMRVLYTSGYTDNAIVHHNVLTEGTQFLSKPFDLDTLTRKVRDVLDDRV